MSLGDGALREEAKLPACTGELHPAGDVLYLRALPAGCAGPSARRSQSRVSQRYGDASIPLYRLDGDRWTLLPRLDESGYGLFTTEHDLWTISSVSPVAEQIRRLTSTGLSTPVRLPTSGGFFDREFTEWNGEVLYTTGFLDNRAFRLRAGAFEPLAAPFFGPRYFVAGTRLFAAGTGTEVYLYDGSGWNVTPGVDGSPEAVDVFLAGDSSLFAVVGAEIWRREGTGWARLPRPPLVNGVPRGFVFQNRPILVNGSRLLAFDGFAWTDLGPFEADVFVTSFSTVPPTLVTPNELWISAQVDTLLRYRDGVLTTFHDSSVQSSPPGGPYENHPTAHVREMGGSIVVFGTAGDAYRLAGEGSDSQVLVPAFSELRDYWPRDGASINGRTFLTVQKKPDTASPPAVLVEVTPFGVRPLITPQDYQRGLGAKQGEEFLGTFGGALLLGGLSLTDGGVLAQRADQTQFSVDPSGLFATTTSYDAASFDTSDCFYRRRASGRRSRPPWTRRASAEGDTGRRSSSLTSRSASLRGARAAGRSFLAGVRRGARSRPAGTARGPGAGLRRPAVRRVRGPRRRSRRFRRRSGLESGGRRERGGDAHGTRFGQLHGLDTSSPSRRAGRLPPAPRDVGRRGRPRTGPECDELRNRSARCAPSAVRKPRSGRSHRLEPSRRPLRRVSRDRVDRRSPWLLREERRGRERRDDRGARNRPGRFRATRKVPPGGRLRQSSYATYRTEISFGRFATDSTCRRGSRTPSRGGLPVRRRLVLFRGLRGRRPARSRRRRVAPGERRLRPAGNRRRNALDLGSGDPGRVRSPGRRGRPRTADRISSAEYGTAVPAFAEGAWARTRAVVPGLLESHAFRSNVAVANPEPEGGPPVTLSVDLRAADGSRIATLPSVTLRPGERRQFNRPLAPRGGRGLRRHHARRRRGTLRRLRRRERQRHGERISLRDDARRVTA